MKKLIAIILSVLVVMTAFAFAGCGETDDGTYSVGIVQLVQHDALDQATEGFKAALTEKLGDKVKFDYQNASGDVATCSTIVDKFVTNKVDLIMANATPAVQAAKEATATIPVVGTSVTDYAGSSLVASNDAPGGNITGASDMNAVTNQMQLIKTFAPDAKNVGIVYCSAEDNSKLQFEEAKEIFEADGYTVNGYAVADVNELIAVVDAAVAENDVFYEPTDNLVAANMEVLKNAAVPAGKVIICGEESMCNAGGVASYSVNYFDVGYEAGLMAYEILANNANPAEMPIKIFSADELTLIQNKEIMAAMGITPIAE
ncbi:MAG: ABC transporter substrate-binding protein [Clostridia bacterium]|nr:ABC transporter substrate-binding protein [Clostridia bacterium]